jgi:hypothetical protein
LSAKWATVASSSPSRYTAASSDRSPAVIVVLFDEIITRLAPSVPASEPRSPSTNAIVPK